MSRFAVASLLAWSGVGISIAGMLPGLRKSATYPTGHRPFLFGVVALGVLLVMAGLMLVPADKP